ncbi:DUF808 domain-containing protein [Thalassotalea agarivorans]|uniref:Inner membrane protein YedI n=1 Tax=Thalassotalea agarivorans TaxID=349064 RepID=A0A1I0E995_THASX|nr:DUF808 domain-containing protein [Thalassotalea agarivorans]SET40939.1 hypothetical protein SAMN05660429_01755 [Thalassotalea agarivorans]
MAGASLLTLLDDIATMMDDVAAMSKVAARKTAGVLGDDLALNAQQVSGVKADRELPVVWAVTKGSFLNKLILVPAALLISAVYPPLITVLLVIGGLFLCFEGAEKVIEKVHGKKHHTPQATTQTSTPEAITALEQTKIKGAIRTDFILSAEIVVIILGTVASESFQMQVMVLSSMAVLFTIGVYGLVAAIVKLDDLGLYLLKKSFTGQFNRFQLYTGRAILVTAPWLMKTLAFVGTLAMFLVGGGILTHSFHSLAEVSGQVTAALLPIVGEWSHWLLPILFDGIIGLIAGLIVVAMFIFATKLVKKR